MRFAVVAASLIAAVAAQYPAGAEETCAPPVTVTVTVTGTPAHTPIAPSSMSAYYPTSTPLVPEASTAVSTPVMGTGTAAPSGTSPPYAQFSGSASGLKVGGALAGVGAVAALLL